MSPALVFGGLAVKVVLVLLTLAGNMSILLVFVKSKALRNRETNIYLASLAATDYMVGAVVAPWYIATDYMMVVLDEPPTLNFCRLLVTIQAGLTITTQLHLIVISLDRYVKIKRDFSYLISSNTKRAWVRVLIIWLISWPIACVSLLANRTMNGCDLLLFDAHVDILIALIGTAVIMMPGVINVCLNCCVYCIIKRKQRKLEIRSHVKIFTVRNNEVIVHSIDNLLFGAKSLSAHIAQLLKQHKTILMILAINLCYLLTWPLVMTIWLFTQLGDHNVAPALVSLVPWAGLMNSLINPIILLTMHVKFRHALMNLFGWPPKASMTSGAFVAARSS